MDFSHAPEGVAWPGRLRRLLSFPALLALLLVAGVYARARVNYPDPDTWWHIAVGEHILRTGAWPQADFFSATVSGNHWIAYEWLGEVAMALAVRVGGLAGQTLLQILLSGLLMILLFYDALLRCGRVKASFVACTLLLPAAAFFFTLRPQVMGYILLLVTLVGLRRYRQGRQKTLWALPLVFLVWANTHGSFSFGLFAIGVYWASGLAAFRFASVFAERWSPEQRIHIAATFLLCLLALTITPYGTRLAAYPLEMALFQPVNVANIIEWQPLSPDIVMGKIFLVVLLLFFLAQLVARPLFRAEEVTLLLFAVFAAAMHRRFLLLFVIVFAPLLALVLARRIPRYEPGRDRPALNAALAVLILAAMVYFFPSHESLEGRVAGYYPHRAVEYLRENPVDGTVWNEYGWGGYLIWTMGPKHKVFIDGRADIYEYAGVLDDYLRIARLAPDALPLLRKYGVEACLVRREAPLATLLGALPEWERTYADSVSVVFVRKGSEARGTTLTNWSWRRPDRLLGEDDLYSPLVLPPPVYKR
jgi:hypothetical protein